MWCKHDVHPTDIMLGHQARLSTSDFSRHCPGFRKTETFSRCTRKMDARRMKKRRRGKSKEGLSGEVTCCPSYRKDGMMDGVWRQRSKDRGRLRLWRSDVAETGNGTLKNKYWVSFDSFDSWWEGKIRVFFCLTWFVRTKISDVRVRDRRVDLKLHWTQLPRWPPYQDNRLHMWQGSQAKGSSKVRPFCFCPPTGPGRRWGWDEPKAISPGKWSSNDFS